MPRVGRRIVAAANAATFAILAAVAVAADAASARGPFDTKAREMFARLVALDTSRQGRQVKAAAEYLAGEFRSAGFEERDVRILPFLDSASLVVRYRGTARGATRPILLLAHLDVVPAKREDWQRNPFELIEENGFFFGRGTSDNKDGVVGIAATLLRLKAEGFVPKRDVIFYASGDEETAQMTTLDTARNHRALIDAEFALNSDGGGGTLDEDSGKAIHFGLQTAEKTYVDYELVASSPGGHSSAPRADNAIYDLAAALQRLQNHRFPVMSNEATLASFRLAGETTSGPLGEALRRFAANPADEAAAEVLGRDPAYVGQTRTTCVATMLAGGHAPNALPQSAKATVNCRVFPGMPLDWVQRTLQQLAGESIKVSAVGEPIWSDASALREDVLAGVRRAVDTVHPGVRVVPAQASGATDGAVFRNVGIPTYGVSGVFMKNSDSFAHGLNERIPVVAFYENLQHWYVLVKTLSGQASARPARAPTSPRPAQ
jgi:acetylornithine deacetylase/succinyl-diaminopimelate desuccinylase-like protein